jgi:trehalose 6-phosphate synthase
MPIEERRERHAAMLSTIEQFDINWWRGCFLRALSGLEGSRNRSSQPEVTDSPTC